jgi:hypothetical protein
MWHVSERRVRDARSMENGSFVSSCPGLTNCGNDQEKSDIYPAELIASGRSSDARVVCIDVSQEMQVSLCSRTLIFVR